jgi:hypothetical protein
MGTSPTVFCRKNHKGENMDWRCIFGHSFERAKSADGTVKRSGGLLEPKTVKVLYVLEKCTRCSFERAYFTDGIIRRDVDAEYLKHLIAEDEV